MTDNETNSGHDERGAQAFRMPKVRSLTPAEVERLLQATSSHPALHKMILHHVKSGRSVPKFTVR